MGEGEGDIRIPRKEQPQGLDFLKGAHGGLRLQDGASVVFGDGLGPWGASSGFEDTGFRIEPVLLIVVGLGELQPQRGIIGVLAQKFPEQGNGLIQVPAFVGGDGFFARR